MNDQAQAIARAYTAGLGLLTELLRHGINAIGGFRCMDDVGTLTFKSVCLFKGLGQCKGQTLAAAGHQEIPEARRQQKRPALKTVPVASALQKEPIGSVNPFTPHRAAPLQGKTVTCLAIKMPGVWPRQE